MRLFIKLFEFTKNPLLIILYLKLIQEVSKGNYNK